MMFGVPAEKELYDTPEECISAELEKHEYKEIDYLAGSIIYEYESDKYCYKFYLSENGYNTSCFLLSKKSENDTIRYCCETWGNNLNFHYDKWYIIGDCYYRVVKSEEEIENFNAVEPIVTEFSIDTANGEHKVFYLLFAVQ